MKYTMHDPAPREHRGIIMLPQYDGWSATWFDFATSEQHPAKIEMEYTQGEPWRDGILSGAFPDTLDAMKVTFYGLDRELVTLRGRNIDEGPLSVWCVGDAVETIRLLTQDEL